MRILHIITRLILGGAQQNTILSCKAQVEAGHDVHLAYGPIFGPEGSLLGEAQATGATLHQINALVRPVQPLIEVQAYRAIQKLVRTIQPDIVHTHSSKAGIVGRVAAWNALDHGRNGSVIHTVHGLPFHDQQSKLIHRLYISLERYAAKHCHQLVAITSQMVDAFIESKITERSKFSVIPSGIDVNFFTNDLPTHEEAKARLGLQPDAPTVGLVARLDRLKGHADLLSTLPDLVQRHPRLQVIMVGDGFDRNAIRAQADTLSCRDAIHWLGRVDLKEMPAIYRAMDVLALPSYQEGQSRVLVEGLLCGCVIVGYAVGGIPAVCIEAVTGRLVPVGNTERLGQILNELLAEPDQREALAEAGYRHVAEKFSAERMNRELLELYERIRG
jgi:glycosyltransferase involved in cell wall biosynthesis